MCEPSWRMVIFDLRGSAFHCGMYLAAGSSSAMPAVGQRHASATPPTIALAIDAV